MLLRLTGPPRQRTGPPAGLGTDYDKASVTRWLQGQQPRGNTPELIAAVLSERLGPPGLPRRPRFLPDQQRPVVGRALVYGEDVAETLHTLAELGSTDISRRTPAGHGALRRGRPDEPSAGMAALAGGDTRGTTDPAVPAPRGGLLRRSGRAGPRDDQHVRRDGQPLRRRRGPHQHRALPVHRGHPHAPAARDRRAPQRQLFAAAARLAAMAGWSSYDAGEYGLAQRYMTQGAAAVRRGAATGCWAVRSWPACPTWRPTWAGPTRGSRLARAGIATAKAARQPARPDAAVRHGRPRTRRAGPPARGGRRTARGRATSGSPAGDRRRVALGALPRPPLPGRPRRRCATGTWAARRTPNGCRR